VRKGIGVILVGAGALLACDRPPSPDGLRDWTPADHDRAEETQRAQSGQQAGPRGSAANGNASLIEATWKTQCLQCHGPLGRGDGPNGPMVQASDLTRADWQAKVTDEQIAMAIKTGKNKMPKFDLPDNVIQGLVQRIRATRAP
jgi:mono/diheme cytochrome c family protein